MDHFTRNSGDTIPMTEQPSTDEFESYMQSDQGKSTGARVGIGCLVVFLVVLILTCGGGIAWYFMSWGKYQDFGNEFVQQGYTLIEDTTVAVNDPETGPLAIVAQAVNIMADIDGDVAIAARAAEIRGTIDGDLDFYGLALHIAPGAHITGDIRIRSAKAVQVEGAVDGSITGEWDAFQDNRPPEREEAADAPEQPDETPVPQ